ncbi:hypothetical protein [uncultured Duncaniella sp.]|uniref:hypothetical protein n=1 Tax=uncultured Duncaniella sp. TaxID=2768039 RepID=UPI00265FBD48|nr:hypothetical protein [uncultured Duncaniella sp.]
MSRYDGILNVVFRMGGALCCPNFVEKVMAMDMTEAVAVPTDHIVLMVVKIFAAL